MPRNPNCTKCFLHKSSVNRCIWGTGDGPGFLIGEAPGAEEAKTGKPSMGESGTVVLRPTLDDFGLSDAYITNTVKCRPPQNRKPEPDEIKTCKPYLLEEIAQRKPEVILLMGAPAMKAMIGKTGITEMNGQLVEKDGQKYVCSFHPAYILRDPSKEAQFRMAVGRYASILRGEFKREMPKWRPIEKLSFDEFIEDWIKAEVISFDTETTGLEWWMEDFKINSIGFSLSNKAGTYEKNWGLTLAKSPVLPFELQKQLLEELARSTAGKIIRGQNGKFDNNCLMRVYAVRFRLDEDVMLAHHIVDENSQHGLKLLARQFCGAPDYDLALEEKKGNTSTKRLLEYNCADSAYTRRLAPVFIKKMDEDEKWLYDRVTMPAARAFEEIEQNGLFVNLDKMAAAEKHIRVQRDQVLKKLNRMAGVEINWNSPPQVAKILYGKLGIVPTVFTDKINPETGTTDTPSTSEDALVDISHPIVDLLTEYREHSKNLSTYTGEWNPKTEKYEGGLRDFMVGPHLYISTKIHGTVTGRYSSRLHSIPRDPQIRGFIEAPPGWDHVQLDLRQAELKVIAITSRDPEMLTCFKTDRDIHWRTLMGAVETGGGEYVEAVIETACKVKSARRMDFPEAIQIVSAMQPDDAIAIMSEWKEGRKKAKGINFGFSYGQSAKGFIGYAKKKYGFEPTLAEASTFRDSFFSTYRMLPSWHERQKILVSKDGFVRSMSGRKRRLPGIHARDKSIRAEAERQAINSPIQGFIGDYKAMILVELMESIPKTHLRVTMEHHDAILMWVKSEYRDLVMRQVRSIANNPRLAREAGFKFPIALDVDMEVGPWGQGKKWKPAQ